MSDNFLPRLAASPDIYLQKVDLAREAGLLIEFAESAYRAASFLDDRILTPVTKGAWAPLPRILEAAAHVREPRPVHFIFHSGHVGSTLLSRLLDESGVALSLREPLTLRTLAEASDVLQTPESLISAERFEQLRGALMNLWSRGYGSTRAVVVKATSSTGRIAAQVLSSAASSRAIYLNVRPEPYLATLLAGRNSAADLRGHGPARIRRLNARLEAQLDPLHALSPGPLAAMSWLAEAWNEREAYEQCIGRVLRVDFERLLSDLAPTMASVVAHLELAVDPRYLAAVDRSPVLTRYSKAAEYEYSPQVRAQLLNQARQEHREEIARGLAWLERLARAEPKVAQLLNERAA